jgi:ferredoxin-NADP reductase
MEEHIVRVLDITPVTHDVNRYRVEKPGGYSFIPGQATDVSINMPEWRDELRPFTFTCLNGDPFLEFTIKSYTDHEGVTKQLLKLKTGDELILRDVWGAINYKGKGVFIAGGAGVTPFIAIFRHLRSIGELQGNKLIFGNKRKEDIILHDEFKEMLGDDFINILSDENLEGYYQGFISESFLKEVIPDFNTNFYVCGPPPMLDLVLKQLGNLGVAENLLTVEL